MHPCTQGISKPHYVKHVSVGCKERVGGFFLCDTAPDVTVFCFLAFKQQRLNSNSTGYTIR